MSIKKYFFWNLILVTFLIKGMSQPYIDANGYQYTNEMEIQNIRKIAILAYGSLVRQRENNQTHARLESTGFIPTEIYFPISLTRQSKGPRLTAVIDIHGEPKRVWAATSKFTFLPNARNNVAAREGSPFKGHRKGYDLSNIFYIKKLLPGQKKDHNEAYITGSSWVIRLPVNMQQENQFLDDNTVHDIIQWAEQYSYSAVLWASFASNISLNEAITKLLHNNNKLLKNTQKYVRNLPDGAQSAFEHALLAGKKSLQSFARNH
ncbi:MAG TPA: hypothetical protein VGW78_06275 [Candidatus Babeliales bacterium]|jgi:hypothetical protein|nr:hypothetical protein [Candidatus Babeliales bacterium]